MSRRGYYKKKRRITALIIICSCILVIIVVALAIFLSSRKPKQYKTYDGDIVVENNYKAPIVIQVIKDMFTASKPEGEEEDLTESDWDGVTLQYNPDTRKGYLNNCVFLGDSRTVAMVNYAFVNDDDALAQIGISHIQFPKNTFTNNAGNSYTMKSYLQSHKSPVVYVSLGVNGMYGISEEDYEKAYVDLIEQIMNIAADSRIVIMSIGPADDNGRYKKTVQNAWIDKYNDFLYELAKEKGLYYLDVNSVLKNSSGGIKSEYDAGDGLHYKSAAYDVIMDYIIHHPVPGVADDGDYVVHYIKPRMENTQMPMDAAGEEAGEAVGEEAVNTEEQQAENPEEATGETGAENQGENLPEENGGNVTTEGGTDSSNAQTVDVQAEMDADTAALLNQLMQ